MLRKSLSILNIFFLLLTLLPNLAWAQTSTNYALGKPFKTTMDDTLKQGAVTDGKTHFEPYFGVDNAAGPVAAIVDLKGIYDVDTVKVWHYWGDNRTYNGTKTEVSEDGENWFTIFDSTVGGLYQETYEGKIHTFTTRKVRYIRDWLNGSTANSYNHWVEIQALGPQTNTSAVQTSGWTWEGESVNGLTGRFSGPVTLSTDKAVGKYSVKVNTQDDPYNAAHYTISGFNLIDTDKYSKVSIWVKPGPGAKQVQFRLLDVEENRTEYITSDNNKDTYFKTGDDLVSGKWNKVELDLKQTNYGGIGKHASYLQIIANEFSTWYWDEAKTIYSPTSQLDLTAMVNGETEMVNGSIRYNKNSTPITYSNSIAWDFTQSIDGWENLQQTFVNYVSSGYLNITSSGNDPAIQTISSFSINTTLNKYIKLKLKNYTNSQTAQIYWKTNLDTNYNEAKSISFPITPNSDFTEYIIDMTNVASWKDNITGIRVDPGTSSGTYGLDYLYIQIKEDPKYSINPTVLVSNSNQKNLPKGIIEKVQVNTNYISSNGTNTVMLSNNKLIQTNASKLTVSGDGKKIYYLNSNDSNKLYLYDNVNKTDRKLADYTDIIELKTGFNGNVIFFVRSNNQLWFFDTRNNLLKFMQTLFEPKFAILSDDTNVLVFNKTIDSNYFITVLNINGDRWDWKQIWGTVFFTSADPQWFYCNNGVIRKLWWVPNIWKETDLMSSPKFNNVTQMMTDKSGTIMYLNIGQTLYSLDVNNKVLRQLNVNNLTKIIKVTNDKKVYYTDSYNDFMVYNPDNDTITRITPYNATLGFFAVDDSGSTMIYDTPNGISVSDLRTSYKPDRYLLSFDGRQSWYTYKNGQWQKITNLTNPSVTDVQNNGMTSDEVNALNAEDFVQLYQDGREIYSFDVAMLFQSPSPYVTPQLNSITVRMSGEGVSEISLLYPKQQTDYDSNKWRNIKKIYPIEIQPKEADVLYFVSNDGGSTLKAYKNGIWNTYQASVLANPSQEWDILTQVGMNAEELKAIPSDQLSSLLPANQISVVNVTQVDDSTTEGYYSKVTVDYTENLFDSANLTLKINYIDGTSLDYPNLTKDQVEDFMEWINQRQFNKGPIFYCLKTVENGVETNEFINYYTVKSVSVKDTP